ncbi:HAD-IA family hydrolase [Thermoleptolyngbya sichuanensis A183]|uniref:HAD-IA family hydrolase n=1 Tax=Thermoleptolyngbya sichuanensis A183 TaxID=2737172 RepID=A0A6M8B3P3_9CYAN|nr:MULTISPECIES: HAD-IA family hydrolase [Thermoleptolyngbya]QKD81444.1 HAD-IA family hydrolase [Thermoleptolyngbya sichuanensis A183]
MLKALLFDLDGTVANTDPLHYQTWKAVMAELGMEIDREFYDAHFSGRLNEQIVRDLLPHLSAEAGAKLSAEKEARFREQATGMEPTPGLWDVLHWMQHHELQRAVVTNAPVENAAFMMKTLALEPLFSVVVLGDELPKGKPDPLPYQTALDCLGVLATEAIAFEDSPSGIRSAVGAGIPTIGIAATHSAEELTQLGTLLVVQDFTDPRLWSLLESARSLQPTHS